MGTKPQNPIKILVVEDTKSNYQLVYAILKKEYELAHAWNGLEAIEMYKSFQPDLILMDINMPFMDGNTATTHIRKMDKKIPIIALTAYTYDKDRRRSIEAGCSDYMTKPFLCEMLIEVVQKWSPKR